MKAFIKAEITSYEGNGEYWVKVADSDYATLIDGDYLVKSDNEPDIIINPDEITGVLGRILDEVDLPIDIQREVEELYNKAAELL